MVIAAPEPKSDLRPVGEQRVLLRGVSWQGYLQIKTMGSTTMNYPGLRKGAEPDNAYYIQNQPLVYGLQDGVYGEVELSPTFSQGPKERLYRFLAIAKDDEIAAAQDLRAWWQGNNHFRDEESSATGQNFG